VALGHRRLAVLDLSDCAAQPMHNARCAGAGRATPLVLVFNGEIYNYRELRSGLVARGHHFLSNSDSEVILHLYEETGTECVTALRGMFAFAVWDEQRESLFCARDRVGKKPFYYRHDGGRFWFASEPRAILADPSVPVRVNPTAIHAYLRLGYVPGPGSAFEGLRRLRPAHYAVVSKKGIDERRYWKLDYLPKRELTEEAAVAELREHLRESVRARLVSDVPLGAFLSGGIDSSAVVAMMSAERARIMTFSIGFEDSQYNELPYARRVADLVGTDHHEFVVRPDATDVMPKLAWHYGEPYADSSAVPTYYLAKLARQHITVALNGDGGDESFGGYTRYVANRVALEYQRLPALVRTALEHAVHRFPRNSSSKSFGHRVQRFFGGASLPTHLRYASWFDFFQDAPGLLAPEFAAVDDGTALQPLEAAFAFHPGVNPIDASMAADIETYLPDDLLVKVDIATMAHGLEARSPLLDHVLMEFAARLPVTLKVHGRQKKWLLRRALRGLIPDEILDRPKTGFGVPLDRWLRTQLADSARDLLLSARARGRGYFRPQAIERLLAEHHSGRAAHGHRLWALLMLELWHQTYVDPARVSAAAPEARSAGL
jgi:asparagine synthase (glutamine-hydrolysing)